METRVSVRHLRKQARCIISRTIIDNDNSKAADGLCLDTLDRRADGLERIGVTPEGLTVSKDRDKKDEKSKNESLAKAGVKFSPGEWRTLLVRVKGGKVTVLTDDDARAEVDPGRLRAGDIPHLVGDPSKLGRATGWRPTITLDETLRGVVDAEAD